MWQTGGHICSWLWIRREKQLTLTSQNQSLDFTEFWREWDKQSHHRDFCFRCEEGNRSSSVWMRTAGISSRKKWRALLWIQKVKSSPPRAVWIYPSLSPKVTLFLNCCANTGRAVHWKNLQKRGIKTELQHYMLAPWIRKLEISHYNQLLT